MKRVTDLKKTGATISLKKATIFLVGCSSEKMRATNVNQDNHLFNSWLLLNVKENQYFTYKSNQDN